MSMKSILQYIKYIFVLIFFFMPLLPGSAYPKVYIDIDTPSGNRLPVAVKEFQYSGKQQDLRLRTGLRDVLLSDLEFSGIFKIIGKKAYLDTSVVAGVFASDIDFRAWRVIGVRILIDGEIRLDGSNIIFDARLFDTASQKRLLSKRLTGSKNEFRRIAHRFADEVMEAITGYAGIFSTRIAYTFSGKGRKDIYMSDYDGHNVVQITDNNSINLSPHWSPDGSAIIYTSYKGSSPHLFERHLRTGIEERIVRSGRTILDGTWSPNGKELAITISRNGNSDIYIYNILGGALKRLTYNSTIDVSPSWSPDGKKIAFVSDRAGNPHIYVINVDGTALKRVTYTGKSNTSPVWSPRGNLIAFAGLNGNKSDIYMIDPDGDNLQKLTDSGVNESPSWSPDGRYIVYSSSDFSRTDSNTSVEIMSIDGALRRKALQGLNSAAELSWSPYLQ